MIEKNQAFRRLVSQLALLLGPLWAPATLSNPTLMLAVPLGWCPPSFHLHLEHHLALSIDCSSHFSGLLLLGALLFMASWRWMRVRVEVEEMETAL